MQPLDGPEEPARPKRASSASPASAGEDGSYWWMPRTATHSGPGLPGRAKPARSVRTGSAATAPQKRRPPRERANCLENPSRRQAGDGTGARLDACPPRGESGQPWIQRLPDHRAEVEADEEDDVGQG